MDKAIGYVSISKDEKRKWMSIENQESKIKLYCEMNELEMVDIIIDRNCNEDVKSRPGINNLFKKLEDTNASLIVYKIDRLGYNFLDILIITEKLNNKRGAYFHSVSEKIDTKTVMGKAFFQMIAAFDEFRINREKEINEC